MPLSIVHPRGLLRPCGAGVVERRLSRYVFVMQTLFDILVPLSLLAVTATLGVGIYALFRGGEFGRSNSNKLMRLRVLLQFIAVLILCAGMWWKAHSS